MTTSFQRRIIICFSLTYCVLCKTVCASTGLVSMEAVTRDVSSDRYHIAEASDTETSLLLVIW